MRSVGGLLRPSEKRPLEFFSSPESHSEGSKRIKIEDSPSVDMSLLAQGVSPDIRPTIEGPLGRGNVVEGGSFPSSRAGGGTSQTCLPSLVSSDRIGTAFTGPLSRYSGASPDSKAPLSPTSANRGLKIYRGLYAAERRRSRVIQEANDSWRDEVCRLLEDAFGPQRENGSEKT